MTSVQFHFSFCNMMKLFNIKVKFEMCRVCIVVRFTSE